MFPALVPLFGSLYLRESLHITVYRTVVKHHHTVVLMFHCLHCLLEHRELGVIHLHYDTCYPVWEVKNFPLSALAVQLIN